MTILSIFPYIVVFLTLFACFTDLRGLKIPNVIPALVLVLYFVYSVMVVESINEIYGNLIAGVGMFFLTFVLFALKMFGAGDAKMATALAFWIGLKGMVAFVFFMTVTGGALGVLALVLMKVEIPQKWRKGWLLSLSEGRPDIPYAIAIFAGTIASFLHINII